MNYRIPITKAFIVIYVHNKFISYRYVFFFSILVYLTIKMFYASKLELFLFYKYAISEYSNTDFVATRKCLFFHYIKCIMYVRICCARLSLGRQRKTNFDKRNNNVNITLRMIRKKNIYNVEKLFSLSIRL